MAAGYQIRLQFMVISSVLAIQLKATFNGNQTNDFYWSHKSNFFNVVQCKPIDRPIISPVVKLQKVFNKNQEVLKKIVEQF